MYYGKQNSQNSDYYNSYKNSYYQYKDGKSYLTLILKILIILLLLVMLFIGFIFMSNKTKVVDKQNLFKVIGKEASVKTEELSKKKEIIFIKNKNNNPTQVNLTQEDIVNIVSIVLHKMNSCKIDTVTNDNNHTKAISKEITVSSSNEMRIIFVKKGDSLSKIAKREYGNYDSYLKILKANPEIIKNPDEIHVGQKLRIPL
ncbi:MAG: LysM peptidoglycan-binding domain-containing protein [Sulfurovaceae bacterium]|nr:LysM peptidoglycan-binding domain-containing protein [Sulfurovaceae bacterium]